MLTRTLFNRKILNFMPSFEEGDGGGGDGDGDVNGGGAGGGGTADWRIGVDETIRDNPSLTKFKDVNGLAKSYLEAQKLVGREKIPIPLRMPLKKTGIRYGRGWVDQRVQKVIPYRNQKN